VADTWRVQNLGVKIEEGTLFIEEFETKDDEIVSYFSEISPDDFEQRLETSLKLGVVALKTIGTTEKIDYIEKKFLKLHQKFTEILKETSDDVENQINEIFGEEGTFSKIIDEHFGEDGKLVKQIFDPTTEGTPLFKLRTLITEKIDGLKTEIGIKKAVEEVTEVTPIKGYEFEDLCEDLLGDAIKHHLGDELERTTTVDGRITGSKKGDFVITLAGRPDCKIVLETKDREHVTLPEIHSVMKEAIENRDAKYGIFVTKWIEALPSGVGCFNEFQGNHLVCALTSKEREGAIQNEILHMAVCWARIRSLLEVAEAEGIDIGLVQARLGEVRTKLQAFTKIKRECTNVENAMDRIRSLSDEIRDGISTELDAIEDEISRVTGNNT